MNVTHLNNEDRITFLEIMSSLIGPGSWEDNFAVLGFCEAFVMTADIFGVYYSMYSKRSEVENLIRSLKPINSGIFWYPLDEEGFEKRLEIINDAIAYYGKKKSKEQ